MADATSIAQRSTKKLHFVHKDMDYYLSWVMGREIYDGSNSAECMEVAARITDGDAASWTREWLPLAELMEMLAQEAVQHGDRSTARRCFLRACTYYRAPLFMMAPTHPQFDALRQNMQRCFQNAARLFDQPIEQIEVNYEGRTLTGYLWKADSSGEKRPTLVVFGGIETFAEDCYFMIGSAAAQRGYHALTVDLPGQGTTPEQGLHFGAKMERPVSAVLDYVVTRPEIDAQRLAVYGFSWGGHIVFKAAQHDPRIKAMIANPPMPNVFRAVLAQQEGHNRHDPISRVVFDQIVWRMGLKISFNPKDIARRFGKAYDYFFNGRADPRRITCPVLLLAGEGEAGITLRIARETYDQLPHPKKKLRIFTAAEGGEAHCQVNNLSLPNDEMLNWLEEILRTA